MAELKNEGSEWIRHQEEGQFFERKSCYDRSSGVPRQRPVRDVARDVAECLVAMANADGGTVVVGVEDDGEISGIGYPDPKLATLRQVTKSHIQPPLESAVHIAHLDNLRVMVFEVDWSFDVHQLKDGRYLRRIGEQNMPFPAHEIESLKQGKRRRATEVQVIDHATLDDLDLTLVEELGRRAGLELEPVEILEKYRLVERRNERLMLTLAALLLFSRDPGQWHSHCDIDFVKFEGIETKTGANLNIIKRERLETPLVRLIPLAYETVQPHVRERQQLVDLFFEERLEYPTFAWQEAIVNAVAHRDYHFQGLGIEIWMFDNRLEVRSPGALVEPVTLEQLRNNVRIHASRNPRIVRVLTDFGFMREQGEGMPRMFEVMEHQGLYPPELRLEGPSVFSLTLKNTPVYSPDTLRWLRQYDALNLSGNQKRLLVYARQHEMVFTSRTYQNLVGIELYAASNDIKDLIRKGIVRLREKGGRVYEVVSSNTLVTGPYPEELDVLGPILRTQGYVKNVDIRQHLGLSVAQANRLAGRLVAMGWLRAEGEKRGRCYYPTDAFY